MSTNIPEVNIRWCLTLPAIYHGIWLYTVKTINKSNDRDKVLLKINWGTWTSDFKSFNKVPLKKWSFTKGILSQWKVRRLGKEWSSQQFQEISEVDPSCSKYMVRQKGRGNYVEGDVQGEAMMSPGDMRLGATSQITELQLISSPSKPTMYHFKISLFCYPYQKVDTSL